MTKWDGFKQTPQDMRFDGAQITEWEGWWKRYRNQFPESARTTRIPRLPRRNRSAPGVASPLPSMVWRDLTPDLLSGYWLIGPAPVRESNNKSNLSAPPDLIDILAGDVDADDSMASRAELCRLAIETGSALAVVQIPRLFLLTLDGKDAYARGLESAVQSVRRDIEQSESRTFHRVALVGMRHSGMDVLACGLAKQTPFQEFCVLDSPFRMNELPPFKAARGRIFTLLTPGMPPAAPKWQSDVAANVLRRNGAIVTVDGPPINTGISGTAPGVYFDAVSAALMHHWHSFKAVQTAGMFIGHPKP